MSAEDHKQALSPGFRLGAYHVVRVPGVGGFGITYLCEHTGLGVQVAVKEYLPNEIAVRDGTEVHPKSSGDREGFEWGLSRFLDEARTLARFEHPNVVRVRDCFEANNTAYIVMDYEDGEPLDELLQRHGTLTEAQLKRLLLPVVDGLRQVHAAGFLHRDIKPANIFVRRSDESPVLLDFGSARQALGRRSRSVTAIASAGYSPPEQYESDGTQGVWTDIYALSALCYRAITGDAPVEAPQRQSEMLRTRIDPLPRLAEAYTARYSSSLLDAVDWGLSLLTTGRPTELNDWLALLDDSAADARTAASRQDARKGERRPRKRAAILAGSAVVGLGLALYFFLADQAPLPASEPLPTLPRNVEGADGMGTESEAAVAVNALPEEQPTSRSLDDQDDQLQRRAVEGDADAQFRLGIKYFNGEGVAKDEGQTTFWFHKAAEQEHTLAQYNLGVMYEAGLGVPEDDAQAASWYRRAAEQGHALAQNNLGGMYYAGRGVPEDDAQAVSWYRKAADHGHAEAQNNLGVMYDNGMGVPEDDAQAVSWYRKAAEQGHAEAQSNLGISYDNGEGVAEDDNQAVLWYRKAAEQGHAGAQNNLGVMYDNGMGVPEDDAQAVLWYRKAAKQGEAMAQSNLGFMYHTGRGVPENYIQAYAWFNLAAAQGSETAEQGKAILRLEMTSAQIADAQQLSRELVD